MSTPTLHWLPNAADWRERFNLFRRAAQPSWDDAIALANLRLDFVRTNALDQATRTAFPDGPPPGGPTRPVRLAILGSATMAHLHGAIRVAALRRGIHVTIYENDYGQYLQELMDKGSALHQFQPTAVLLSLDPAHLTAGLDASLTQADADAAFTAICTKIEQCWDLARTAFRCPILHQTPLPVALPLMGNNEHMLPGSRYGMILRLNTALRDMAAATGVDLVAIDARAARDGLGAWHDPALWLRSKQEITLSAAPFYGELVARLLAARQGRSAKCLVLDLDNTVWGGVVGDDGMDGLVLGQGSPLGEGFVAVQDYAKDLARRGVILAVCSKNDEANALEPFERHPEMILKRSDIACFVANWNDKATNIRTIAASLNIGLDALVFLDDNPFERNLVRGELPMVAVPEVSDDPALVPTCLADAGYFESLSITEEDRERTQQYQANRNRESLMATTTDMPTYLRSLEMQLLVRPFDRLGLQRTTQLINKTNQFNLTTRRYTEDEVLAVMQDPHGFGLQFRLVDRFGDNGIIGIIIGKRIDDDVLIDTWLMSCRVLGRGVEVTMLNVVAARSRQLGATRLIGEYYPTKKNGMVRDHYDKLGFATLEAHADGRSRSALPLAEVATLSSFIAVREN
jgi:FkbH-like protein